MIINTGVIFQKTLKFFQNNRITIISKAALNTRVCAYNWMLNNNVRTVGMVQSLITTHLPILLFPSQKHYNTTSFSELGGHHFRALNKPCKLKLRRAVVLWTAKKDNHCTSYKNYPSPTMRGTQEQHRYNSAVTQKLHVPGIKDFGKWDWLPP